MLWENLGRAKAKDTGRKYTGLEKVNGGQV